MSRRTGVLLAASAVALLVLYFVAATGFVQLFALVLGDQPDPVTYTAVAVVTALVFGYLSYRVATARIVASLDAVELPAARAPGFYRRLDALSESMGVDRPRVLVASLGAPNALALGGGSDGVLVVDQRLFSLLDGDELETILAHELAHLERRDALVQTLGYSLVQTVAGLLSVLLLPLSVLLVVVQRIVGRLAGFEPVPLGEHFLRVHFLVSQVVVVAMLLFTLVLRAFSREREYAADDRAAAVTGKPMSLASALYRIERVSAPQRGLLSPFVIYGDEEGTLTRLLATHPPMDERIERLVERAERDAVTVPIQ